MNKRITSLLLCFVMVFTMLATAVPALAAPDDACTFTVKADKTSANPGETITFTIYMEQVGVILGLEGTLKIPSGLTYVAGSGKTADGIKTTLGWDAFDWTEESLFLNGYGSENYTATSEIALMTFQCTVDSDAVAKAYSVTFDEALAANELGDPKEVTVVPATVTVTIPHVHVYDKEVATEGYLKTGATCTEAAVYYKSCECGAKGTETFTSGSALGHDYTQKFEDDAHLKTAASKCTEHNIYWFDCSRCDSNAKNDPEAANKYFTSSTTGSHSFTQQIEDAAHHVADTGTDCQSVKQYYYDCAYCDQMGTATWDSTTNGPHNYAATWSSNAGGHWHECSLCHDKKDNEAHTPDHTGHATEEYAIKCTECGYEMEAQLGHTHVFDKEVATDDYKATDATCTAKATYYKSCACGEKGTETFEYGELAAHNPASGWTSDASGHWHACQTANCTEKCDVATHTPDHQGHATEEYAIKCTECGYEMEAQLVARTPVTNIAATVTAPALGQKPDYAPVIVANPADSVDLEEVYWYKIAVADFTGTDGDDWDRMASDEAFTTGYYYSVDMYFDTNDGYKMSESATGTVNGMPHDDTYGELYEEGDSAAYLCGLFEPLETEYTVDLPFSLAVKLTGDKKPAKETFKFEIYDLGVENAEFEIVNDSITAENIAFDENGVAFIEGSLKIKVTGEDQLSNLTEGFSVRMVKGSTKGWTYASEQWRIEPSFENDALDLKIAVKEIVDGEISEEYANGMSFSVGYEAVTEPETPQTGDSSMMVLWIALLFASGFGVVTTAVYGKKRKTVK